MKITLEQTINLWNVLTEVKAIYTARQQPVPDIVTANMAYLRPEVRKWSELTDGERLAFLEAELEIPMVKIKKDQLPTIPSDLKEALSIIVDGKLEDNKSALERLIEESKNGNIFKEESELKKELRRLTKESGADHTRIQLDPTLYDALRHDDEVTEHEDYLVHSKYPDVKMFLMGSEIKEDHIGS
mgnify:CR=1 FL=1